MRIIGGKWRRHTLRAPRTSRTRPVLDRVKTSIFDQLGALMERPGTISHVNVLDLFAGSGAFGLEALSRGAAHCCFVESGRAALAALRSNVLALGCREDVHIRAADAFRTAVHCPWPEGYALCFVDPPYRYLREPRRRIQVVDLLERLAVSPAVRPDALILFRCESDVDSLGNLSGSELIDRRTFGSMCLWWFRVSRAAREEPGDEPNPTS